MVTSATATPDGWKHNTHNSKCQATTTNHLFWALSSVSLLKYSSVWSLEEAISPTQSNHIWKATFVYPSLPMLSNISWEPLHLMLQNARLVRKLSLRRTGIQEISDESPVLSVQKWHERVEHYRPRGPLTVALPSPCPREHREMSGDVFGCGTGEGWDYWHPVGRGQRWSWLHNEPNYTALSSHGKSAKAEKLH